MESYYFVTFCEGKASLPIEIQLHTHSKTILKSYYVKKNVFVQESLPKAESILPQNRLPSQVYVVNSKLLNGIISSDCAMYSTMKILTIPTRLGTILMANIKFWADKASKRQVSYLKNGTLHVVTASHIIMVKRELFTIDLCDLNLFCGSKNNHRLQKCQ